MSDYPQTPIEFVSQALEEAKTRGAVSSMIEPVLSLAEKGSWEKAREVVDMAIRKTPEACANLRTKLSWASAWAKGRLPGSMQADLENHMYSPEDIRDAWLDVISGGKYVPPKPKAKQTEVTVTVDGPTEKQTTEQSAQESPSKEPTKGVEIQEGDNYADIQKAIDEGIL